MCNWSDVSHPQWILLTFYNGSEISEVDLKSKVGRFVAKWGQIVLGSSRDLKSTFSRFGVKWGRISRLGWLPGLATTARRAYIGHFRLTGY